MITALLSFCMILFLLPGTAFADKNESITVGKTKRLTLNTGEAAFHGRWESSDPNAVDIISQDGITCEIKALKIPTFQNPVGVYCTYEVQTPRRTYQTKVEVYWVTVSESNASSGGDYTISVSESSLNIDMANGGGVMVICGVPFSNDVWLEFEATQGKCGYSFDYDGNRAWVGIYPESTGKGACVVKLIRSTGKNKVSIMQKQTIRYTAYCSHYFGSSGTVTQEPTYTTEGTIVYTCIRCGYSKTDRIPVLTPTPDPTPAQTPDPTPAWTPEPAPAWTPEPAPAQTPEPTPAWIPEPVAPPTPDPVYYAYMTILQNYRTQAEKEQRDMDRKAAALYAQARRTEEARVARETRRAEEALLTAEREILCAQCGRRISSDSSYCMFCGQAVQPSSRWSRWSEWSTKPVKSSATREVEQRQTLIGYNMFHYRTQFRDEPYWRVFRNFSVNGDYDALYSRHSYGEKYVERYVTASELADAVTVWPDSWNVYPRKGFQDGVTTAFDFGDDEFLWFIDSAVYETMYRYRDLI